MGRIATKYNVRPIHKPDWWREPLHGVKAFGWREPFALRESFCAAWTLLRCVNAFALRERFCAT
jgi:hypothetical protein